MELFSGHSVVSAKYLYKFENVFLGIYRCSVNASYTTELPAIVSKPKTCHQKG